MNRGAEGPPLRRHIEELLIEMEANYPVMRLSEKPDTLDEICTQMSMLVCLECSQKHLDLPGDVCPLCDGEVVPVRRSGSEASGRLIADKYLLLNRLGQGGMGTVYRAHQEELDRFVAVKLLRLNHLGRSDVLRRFYAEAKNTSRLQHRHNVHVYDFGHTEDGLLYLVMEYLKGLPLSRLPLPLEPIRALTILEQVCAGLGEAHDVGLVHRDLKPDNILVTNQDGDFARIIDYGIAKFEDSVTQLTADGKLVGTARYMAPEQASSTRVDRRADIYALGVILYELLSGQPPFRATDPIALVYMHKHERPPALGKLVPTLPVSLERLVMRCLAKDRERRPQDIGTLRADLVAIRDAIGQETGEGLPQHKLQPIVDTRTEESTLPGTTQTDDFFDMETRDASPGALPIAMAEGGAIRGTARLPWVIALVSVSVAVFVVSQSAQPEPVAQAAATSEIDDELGGVEIQPEGALLETSGPAAELPSDNLTGDGLPSPEMVVTDRSSGDTAQSPTQPSESDPSQLLNTHALGLHALLAASTITPTERVSALPGLMASHIRAPARPPGILPAVGLTGTLPLTGPTVSELLAQSASETTTDDTQEPPFGRTETQEDRNQGNEDEDEDEDDRREERRRSRSSDEDEVDPRERLRQLSDELVGP